MPNPDTLLASIDPTTIAVLSNIGTSESIVQLKTGGPAVLSMPTAPPPINIDGQLFRVNLSGLIHNAGSTRTCCTLRGYCGSVIDSKYQVGELGTHVLGLTTVSFYVEGDLLWSSAIQICKGHYTYDVDCHGGSAHYWSVPPRWIPTQSGLKYIASARFHVAHPQNSVTVTQFDMRRI